MLEKREGRRAPNANGRTIADRDRSARPEDSVVVDASSAAARFEAFERENLSVSRNADAPPPGVAVVDAHVLRGGALLDPNRRWVEVEPGWFVVQ